MPQQRMSEWTRTTTMHVLYRNCDESCMLLQSKKCVPCLSARLAPAVRLHPALLTGKLKLPVWKWGPSSGSIIWWFRTAHTVARRDLQLCMINCSRSLFMFPIIFLLVYYPWTLSLSYLSPLKIIDRHMTFGIRVDVHYVSIHSKNCTSIKKIKTTHDFRRRD